MKIILVIFCFVFLSSGFSGENDGVRVELARLEYSVFAQEVAVQTAERMQILTRSLAEHEKIKVQTIRERVLHSLKIKLKNSWLDVVGLVRNHGKPVVIANIVTLGVIPSISMFFGFEGVAAFSSGFPTTPLVISAQALMVYEQEKLRLINALRISRKELKKLRKARREILGFAVEKKLFSLAIEQGGEVQEIRVLKRPLDKWQQLFGILQVDRNTLLLEDLVSIAKEHLGEEIVDLAKTVNRDNDRLYGSLLSHLIMQEPAAFFALVGKIREHLHTSHLSGQTHIEEQFTKVYEKVSLAKDLLVQARDRAAVLLKISDRYVFWEAQKSVNKKIIQDYFDAINYDLNTLQFEIKMYEFEFLQKILKGEEVKDDYINKKLQLKEKVQYFKYHLNLSVGRLGDAGDELSREQFNEVLKYLHEHVKNWQPYADNRMDCRQLAEHFLLK